MGIGGVPGVQGAKPECKIEKILVFDKIANESKESIVIGHKSGQV